MKILTLNTWQELGPVPWEERWEVTLAGIEQFRPNLVAFQELFNPAWAQEIQKKTAYPTLVFPKGHSGLVLYSGYPVVEWGEATLSQSPFEDYLRYALWAELRVNEQTLFVFVTHLSWMLEDGETRRKQAEEILQLVDSKAANREMLLLGDLNAPRHSPEISFLIKKGQFRDLFFEKHPNVSGFTWDNRNPYAAGAKHILPDRRIDFILARGSGPLLEDLAACDLVFTKPNAKGFWASDHSGVLAQFR